MKQKKYIPWLYILPYFISFMIFFVIPFLYGIVMSFTNYDFSSNVKFIGMKNYINLFTPSNIYFQQFWNAIKNTFIFIVLTVPALILIPLIIAQLLHSNKKFTGFFQSIFYMPTLFSVTSAMLVWTWLMNNETGILNFYLNKAFGVKLPWLTTTKWGWIAMVIATVWWTMGTNMIIFSAGIEDVPKDLYEAAEVDGASAFRKFISITIPSLKNQLVYTVLMTIIASSNVFGQPYIMTGGGPGRATQSISMLIRDVAFTGTIPRAGQSAAMSVIFGLLVIVVSFIAMIFLNKSMKTE